MRQRIQDLLQSNLHVKTISASIPRSHHEHRDLLVSVDNLQAERPLRLGSSCPRSLFGMLLLLLRLVGLLGPCS